MSSSHTLIRSPWRDDLLHLVSSARHSVAAVAPYITRDGIETLIDAIRDPDAVEVLLGTTFSAASVASGSMDINALHWACEKLPRLRICHIPRLHAKIYIADDSAAIVTSGNLTTSSLLHNNEYGVGIFDRSTVLSIKRDVSDYTALGSFATCDFVVQLCDLATGILPVIDDPRNADSARAMAEFDDVVRSLRGNAGEARTSIFARTVLHVLRAGPMKTSDIHETVSDLQPDLCDDAEERVINGVKFGKLWKHDVRNAQQTLKRRGRVKQVGGLWSLVAQ